MSTKEILVQAAINVLNDDASATMLAIADQAGVNRRTLHRHFSSKEQLVQACVSAISSQILKDVKQAIEQHASPIDQLKQMFVDDVAKGQHFEFVQKFRSLSDEAVQAEFDEMGKLFYRVLDKLKEDGRADAKLSNDWLAYVWMGLVRSTNQALKDGAIAPKEASELGWKAFSNGMLNEH